MPKSTSFGEFINRLLFGSPNLPCTPSMRVAERLLLLILYILGVSYWLRLLEFGAIQRSTLDWSWVFAFYSVIKAALTDFQAPYYISLLYNGSDHFLAFVDIPYSPQVLLLRVIPIEGYLVVNVLLLYTLAFHGCLLIRRRYGLSLAAFSLLFPLMVLNGYVTSHIAAGHMQWFACFLLPYFIYLTLEITKDRFPFRRALLIALVLFAILLQGSIHIAVIAGMYLLLIVALNLSLTSVLRFVQITALAGSMALCKLLPAIFFFGDKTRDFVPGYYSVCELLNRLTTLNQPAKIEGYWQAGDWVPLVFPWECDAYIGFAGLAFLVACGICLRFRRWSAMHEMRFKNMDWPMLLMVFFSFELNFYIVRTLQIPLISTVERVPSRFIIMPLLTLIAISAIRYQGLLNEQRGALLPRALGVLCALHVFHMLWLNGTRWCVSTLPRLEERQAGIVSGGDRPYEIVVLLSIIPTLIACIVWGYLYWRVTRRRTGQDTPTPSGNGQTERPAPPEPAGTS